MKLKDLLRGVDVTHWASDPEMEIAGVSSDTRENIAQGFLFVALSGFAFDGNRFIPMALVNPENANIFRREGQDPPLQFRIIEQRDKSEFYTPG